MTNEDLAEALARAQKAKTRLDAELEDLNAVIAEFEEGLNRRKFGMRASVRIEREISEESDEWECWLVYRKKGKRWGLFLETAPSDATDDDEMHVEELARAGRDRRLLAIQHFPELLKDITEQLEERLGERQRAISRARELANMLNEPKEPVNEYGALPWEAGYEDDESQSGAKK